MMGLAGAVAGATEDGGGATDGYPETVGADAPHASGEASGCTSSGN